MQIADAQVARWCARERTGGALESEPAPRGLVKRNQATLLPRKSGLKSPFARSVRPRAIKPLPLRAASLRLLAA